VEHHYPIHFHGVVLKNEKNITSFTYCYYQYYYYYYYYVGLSYTLKHTHLLTLRIYLEENEQGASVIIWKAILTGSYECFSCHWNQTSYICDQLKFMTRKQGWIYGCGDPGAVNMWRPLCVTKCLGMTIILLFSLQ
jgi:hypothetical protein